MFLDAKNPCLFCLSLGIFKENKDFGPTFFQMSCQGYFLRTRCLTPKTHCLYGLSKSWDFFFTEILGLFGKFQVKHPSKYIFLTPKTHILLVKILGFKEYRDIGLTLYRNLRFSSCQNIGLFHKIHVFDAKKPIGLFCLSKSWDF